MVLLGDKPLPLEAAAVEVDNAGESVVVEEVLVELALVELVLPDSMDVTYTVVWELVLAEVIVVRSLDEEEVGLEVEDSDEDEVGDGVDELLLSVALVLLAAVLEDDSLSVVAAVLEAAVEEGAVVDSAVSLVVAGSELAAAVVSAAVVDAAAAGALVDIAVISKPTND